MWWVLVFVVLPSSVECFSSGCDPLTKTKPTGSMLGISDGSVKRSTAFDCKDPGKRELSVVGLFLESRGPEAVS